MTNYVLGSLLLVAIAAASDNSDMLQNTVISQSTKNGTEFGAAATAAVASGIDNWTSPQAFLAALTPQEQQVVGALLQAMNAAAAAKAAAAAASSAAPAAAADPLIDADAAKKTIVDNPNIYLDGLNPIKVTPNISTNFALEMFYSIDMAAHGITVNKTHAFLPFEKPFQWNYMMRTNPTDNVEYGISKWFFDGNSFATMNPHIMTGTGEKMHMLYSKNEPPQARLKQEEEAKAAQTTEEAESANANNEKRTFLMNLYVGLNRVSSQMKFGGAMDVVQQQPLFDFALTDEGRPNQRMKAGMETMRTESAKFFSDLQNVEPIADKVLSARVACSHWTNGYNPADGGHYMPLDTKLPVFKGHLSMSPYNYWEAASATSVFHYNNETKRLELYEASSIFSHFRDPLGQDPFKPSLYVNSADGVSMEVPPIVRQPIVTPNPLLHGLYNLIQAMPKKYGVWAGGREEVCPAALEQWCAGYFTSDNYVALQKSFVTGMTPAQSWQFTWVVTKCTVCEIDFVKSVPKHIQSETYSLFSATAAYHGTSEVVSRSIVPGLFGKFWNDLDSKLV